MKKLSYIMLFLVLGMSLTAQSVWDGSREAISSGSGTESDPYLIENAQQLAWLAYVVNWDYSIWTKDKFFLLTTDIDLGGNADNQWIPIGAGPSTDSHKLFDGVFDGGFHSITGIYIDADNAVNDNNSMWMSSYAGFFTELGSNAVVKNLYLEGSIETGRKAGGFAGTSNGVFEYCVSNVAVESTSQTAAGIASYGNPTVRYCANIGDIKGKTGVGGLIGINGRVENSYNMGRVEAEDMVGGIAGRSTFINNCYNVGEIHYAANANNRGAIIGNKPSSATVGNCYYLEDCIAASNNYGEPKSADFMHSQEFVSLLNNETDVWTMDVDNSNDGYPVFSNTPFGVEEILTDFSDVVTVYPNPVIDYVCVAGDVVSCDIFDLVGKRVFSISTNINKIAVSDLPSGIYMMRFLTKNGNLVTKKIVKK